MSLQVRDPRKRLGSRSSLEVKRHPFFKDIQWDRVTTDKPVFVPQLDDATDTRSVAPAQMAACSICPKWLHALSVCHVLPLAWSAGTSPCLVRFLLTPVIHVAATLIPTRSDGLLLLQSLQARVLPVPTPSEMCRQRRERLEKGTQRGQRNQEPQGLSTATLNLPIQPSYKGTNASSPCVISVRRVVTRDHARTVTRAADL